MHVKGKLRESLEHAFPAVMETMFSWFIMVTHGYFMVMFLYSILMVKNVTIVQQKHG